jgi:hypothetical protein
VLAVLIVLRGAMLGIMPDAVIALATTVSRNPPVSALLGAWLSFIDWISKSV